MPSASTENKIQGPTTPKLPSPRMDTRRSLERGNSHGVNLGFLASTDDDPSDSCTVKRKHNERELLAKLMRSGQLYVSNKLCPTPDLHHTLKHIQFRH